MIIGIPKEIKDNENRVSMPPGGAHTLIQAGHQVVVEAGAGVGSGFDDEQYKQCGAKVAKDVAEVWGEADLVQKVKEPQPSEFEYMRDDLVLFTYLHLAAEEELTKAMMERGITGVAYETVELANRQLPLLTPMSEVAGRMSIQVAAHYLEQPNGGRGKLLGGVPGVRASDVVIIGGGVVGTNAAQMALGMGARVIIIDRDLDRLRFLSEVLHGSLTTLASNPLNIADAARIADVLIGGVLIAGAAAPQLVSRETVSTMQPGSVIVDVAVDQGGCIETTKPTTHSDPIYYVDGVVHYGVTNMPGAVPRTSTYALSNATLPYTLDLANKGFKAAVQEDPTLALGVNTYQGHITYPAVAEEFGLDYKALDELM
jgi:alanine dehydrogenase